MYTFVSYFSYFVRYTKRNMDFYNMVYLFGVAIFKILFVESGKEARTDPMSVCHL